MKNLSPSTHNTLRRQTDIKGNLYIEIFIEYRDTTEYIEIQ